MITHQRDGRRTRARVYRVRLSPRATAALSVPHVHSEPAIAAAVRHGQQPADARGPARRQLVGARERHDGARRERRLRVRRACCVLAISAR